MLVDEYCRGIEDVIASCPHVHEYKLHFDKRSLYIGLVEGRVYFMNNLILHFIEFVNVKAGIERYKYSYHVQNEKEELIFRYDMSPHHKEIKTFPHHKHLASGEVQKANAPSLRDVIYEVGDVTKNT